MTPKLSPELVPPKFDEAFPCGDLPVNEREGGRSLEVNVAAMLQYARQFSESVALYEVSRRQSQGHDLWRAWTFLAARAGIIAVYNYRMAMDGVMDARRQCKTWEKLLDNAALESARDKFREEFPHTRELRQTVKHGAERFWKTDRRRQNEITKGHKDEHQEVDPGTTAVIDSNFYNSEYVCQFGAQTYRLDMSAANARRLVVLTSEFLKPLEEFVRKLAAR